MNNRIDEEILETVYSSILPNDENLIDKTRIFIGSAPKSADRHGNIFQKGYDVLRIFTK